MTGRTLPVPINVTTSIDLSDDTTVQRVCAFATVDLRQGSEPREPVKGFADIGDPDTYRPLSLTGTAGQLRGLAKALEDAAMEMERLHADAHADWTRRQHYEAAEAEAAPGRYPERTTDAVTDKARNDLDLDDLAGRR